MDHRDRRNACHSERKRTLPVVLAVVGFVLLLCCLPLWAVFAIVGLGLVVCALALMC